MGKLFDAIYESVVSRTDIGGYLPGDCVRFRKNYKTSGAYKAMSSDLQKQVDELASCGLNIRVIQVGDRLSGASAGNQHKTGDNVVITIAADQGGGRNYARIAVSPDMIDLVEYDNINQPPIPDEFKRKERINIKPEKLVDDASHITRQTDKGNGKHSPGEYKLAESVDHRQDFKNLEGLYEDIQ